MTIRDLIDNGDACHGVIGFLEDWCGRALRNEQLVASVTGDELRQVIEMIEARWLPLVVYLEGLPAIPDRFDIFSQSN